MIKMQFWDCSGQQKFRSVIKAYINGAKGILLLYDISQRSSFLAIPNWIKDIREKNPHSIIILIGHKCDLNEREISREEGEKIADEYGLGFFEVSSKNNYNVDEILNYLIQQSIFNTGEAADIGAAK